MRLILTITSAVLLILSFPSFNLEFLAWVALVPLFLAIENKKPFKAFLIAYLFGVLFFLGTIYWLIHVTLPGMILVVLYLALYFGLFGLVASYGLRVTGYGLLFFIPAAWVTLEWLRSTGPAGFGWSLLAHSQSFNLPIIQIADITGAYGVSFLVVMANVMAFLAVKNFKGISRVIIPMVICGLLISSALIYGYVRLNNIFTGERVKVAVIQGNIPQAKKWDYNFRDEILNKYEGLTREALKEKPDLVIWPETSVPGYLGRERDLSERMKTLAKDIKTPLLVGAPREDEVMKDKYYNSAILLLEDGRIIDRYDKLHLVPFGEYIPFEDIFSFVEKFAETPIGDFTGGRDYTVFKFFIERSSKDKDAIWRLVKKVKFSSLICFEDIFPGLAREFVRNGADFLVNITNDAWFGKSSAPYQHAQSSVFRAVENRVNIVRAANTGLSCFIDQKGRVIDSVEADGADLFIDGFKSSEIVL
ncbi:MAG: apolipoprotein N-acyltransferase, partial [Candidatus Omnitrophica bacterium]|nr:apolipoprotein N-acyltransferase [Candidatus Omnitrophota bacterium]